MPNAPNGASCAARRPTSVSPDMRSTRDQRSTTSLNGYRDARGSISIGMDRCAAYVRIARTVAGETVGSMTNYYETTTEVFAENESAARSSGVNRYTETLVGATGLELVNPPPCEGDGTVGDNLRQPGTIVFPTTWGHPRISRDGHTRTG